MVKVMTTRVTLVQAGWELGDPAHSLEAIRENVEGHRQNDLIVFPELAVHGHDVSTGSYTHLASALRAVGKDRIEDFHAFVRKKGTPVIYGRAVEDHGAMFNVATYVDPDQVVDYAKTHVHWTERFARGHDYPVVRTPFGRLGMQICFDAAFPEVGRILALNGAQLIVNISNIPEGFPLKHLHRRAQACSVANQVYTIFVNRTGEGFLGGSCVVDPEGEIVVLAGADEEVIDVDLDIAAVERWREAEPTFVHRRPETYQPLTHAEGSLESGITK